MVPGDPKDDYLVALARVSGAGYLVSGDPHLTAASLDAASVTVLTPRRFSEMLEESDR
jgi:predicted nucleic acid-binding protein